MCMDFSPELVELLFHFQHGIIRLPIEPQLHVVFYKGDLAKSIGFQEQPVAVQAVQGRFVFPELFQQNPVLIVLRFKGDIRRPDLNIGIGFLKP